MRTQNFLRHLTIGALLLTSGQVAGQASVLGNAGGPTDYLGWDNTNPFPLMVRHNANQPIDWYTSAIRRMRLTPNVTSAMGPGDPFPGVQRNGYLLLSGQPNAFTNPASRAPFTRLHLIDQQTGILDPVVYAQEHGFRPWQRNGITFTGNSDQSYIGHKYAGNDNTDFVIHWSDKQRLRRPRSETPRG